MTYRFEANGASKVKVHLTKKADDYFIIYVDDVSRLAEGTAAFVGQTWNSGWPTIPKSRYAAPVRSRRTGRPSSSTSGTTRARHDSREAS